MNPASDESNAAPVMKDPRRKRVFQRRLHKQLSESRMLEVLDRSLRSGAGNGLGNQEQEERDSRVGQDEEEEQELVCVSKMVRMADPVPAVARSSEFQVGGVLKTVRYIHMQRAIQPVQHGNQTEH